VKADKLRVLLGLRPEPDQVQHRAQAERVGQRGQYRALERASEIEGEKVADEEANPAQVHRNHLTDERPDREEDRAHENEVGEQEQHEHAAKSPRMVRDP
jgi:hypothetical protein